LFPHVSYLYALDQYSRSWQEPTWVYRPQALLIIAGAVGALAFGALLVASAPVLLPTIVLGAAVGVVSAGIISYMSYSDANGSPLSSDQSFDDWGKRAPHCFTRDLTRG
jgi:hypothetical protein